MQRFDAHARYPSLDLVIAYSGAEPVGQTWGFPVAKPTISGPPVDPTGADGPSGSANEEGKRTFVLAEIMVRKALTGQGIAHALHNELLAPHREICRAIRTTRQHRRIPCLPEVGLAQGRGDAPGHAARAAVRRTYTAAANALICDLVALQVPASVMPSDPCQPLLQAVTPAPGSLRRRFPPFWVTPCSPAAIAHRHERPVAAFSVTDHDSYHPGFAWPGDR